MKLSLTGFTLFAALLSAQAFAGATNADLNCKSRDGHSIAGNIPGDFSEFDLSVEKAGQQVRLFSVINQENGDIQENAKIAVVDALSDGVWTLNVQRGGENYGWVSMHALPKTVKLKTTRNGYRASFEAKGSFNLSELSGQTVERAYSCNLVYEI